MAKNDFIDRKLIGVKSRLTTPIKDETKDKHNITVGMEDDITDSCEANNESLKNENSNVITDKRYLKALNEKKDDFIRTKKVVIEKIESYIGQLEQNIENANKNLSDFQKASSELKKKLSEILEIDYTDWNKEDFSLDLANASKKVENARLEYLTLTSRLSTSICENDVQSQSKVFTINELLSLTPIQLIKLGFWVAFPIIIGLIITAVIISLSILLAMGSF